MRIAGFGTSNIEARRRVNFDHPDAFETSLLVEHVKALRAGQAIEQPLYSYEESVRKSETRRVEPKHSL